MRQWVRGLPRAERDVFVAAETVYRQRRLATLETNGADADHDPLIRTRLDRTRGTSTTGR